VPAIATTPRVRRHSSQPLADDPPMRFSDPPAHEVTGSDQRRSYQLQLCGAFRLSQPLDAFLHPKPFRPCFMPVTLMGFSPSEGFPRRKPGWAQAQLQAATLHDHPFPSCRFRDSRECRHPEGHRRPRLTCGSKELSIRQIRSRGPVLPGGLRADPLLAFPLRGFDLPGPRSRVSAVPPLMGFDMTPDGHPPIAMSALQSVKEPGG
jgi:hypothetical protein